MPIRSFVLHMGNENIVPYNVTKKNHLYNDVKMWHQKNTWNVSNVS